MTPFYFGKGSRNLFGIYRPANQAAGPTRAALLCNPFGEEYVHSHRAIRQASISLAVAGMHTLRFDYFGTGDSAGESQEADLEIWYDDIICAAQELQDMSGAHRVTLVGLRLGALLAARVAAAFPQTFDRLILWDPVLSGEAYLHEQFRACYQPRLFGRGPVPRPDHTGGGYEVLGYPLAEGMIRDLNTLDMRSLAGDLPAHTFALTSGTLDDATKLRAALLSRQIDVPAQCFAGPPCWEPVWPDPVALIPAELIERLVHVAV